MKCQSVCLRAWDEYAEVFPEAPYMRGAFVTYKLSRGETRQKAFVPRHSYITVSQAAPHFSLAF